MPLIELLWSLVVVGVIYIHNKDRQTILLYGVLRVAAGIREHLTSSCRQDADKNILETHRRRRVGKRPVVQW